MLVSDIITRVRVAIGDNESISVSDADIMRWINDAMREVAASNQLLQVTGVQNTIVGTEGYALPSAPTLLKLHSVRYDKLKLPIYTRAEAEDRLGIDGTTKGSPSVAWVWSNKINLWPIPDSVKELEINYTRQPTDVTAVGNTPDLPVQYHRRLVDYCLAQVAEMDDDMARYQLKMQEFETGVQKIKDVPDWEDDYYSYISAASRDMGESDY